MSIKAKQSKAVNIDEFGTIYSCDDLVQINQLNHGCFIDSYQVLSLSNNRLKLIVSRGILLSNDLLEEVSSIRTLSHPNLISIQGFLLVGHKCHILTDYPGVQCLSNYLRISRVILTCQQRVHVAFDIVKALSYLHNKKRIHGHLSSNSVYLKFNSGVVTSVLEILPSPISNLSRLDESLTNSFHWTSPEQIKGKPFTESTDIFAYGIILCELTLHSFAGDGVLHRNNDFGVNMSCLSSSLLQFPASWKRLLQDCVKVRGMFRPTASEINNRFNNFILNDILKDGLEYVPDQNNLEKRFDPSVIFTPALISDVLNKTLFKRLKFHQHPLPRRFSVPLSDISFSNVPSILNRTRPRSNSFHIISHSVSQLSSKGFDSGRGSLDFADYSPSDASDISINTETACLQVTSMFEFLETTHDEEGLDEDNYCSKDIVHNNSDFACKQVNSMFQFLDASHDEERFEGDRVSPKDIVHNNSDSACKQVNSMFQFLDASHDEERFEGDRVSPTDIVLNTEKAGFSDDNISDNSTSITKASSFDGASKSTDLLVDKVNNRSCCSCAIL